MNVSGHTEDIKKQLAGAEKVKMFPCFMGCDFASTVSQLETGGCSRHPVQQASGGASHVLLQ